MSLTLNAPTTNRKLLEWVEEIAALCEPEAIHWFDGSDEEVELLSKQLVDAGTFVELDPTRRPGSTGPPPTRATSPGSRTAPSSAPSAKPTPGPRTTGWTRPRCARSSHELFRGSMRGRTMYVVPFSMGPLGSPLSYIGVEVTDSPYVALSACGS